MAAVAFQHRRCQQAQQRSVGRIHRDGRVQIQALLVAIIAQAGAVLNGQDVPPCHPLQQIRPRRRHHLRRRHSPVVQQSSKPHLASPDAAQPAQADTVRTKRAQPLQQKAP
ncbi:MAG: hypothetical protein JF604_19430, partial [Bradyrhizobium sp.]|nr:hypothetical protein [Bradyrhizobium sp.]